MYAPLEIGLIPLVLDVMEFTLDAALKWQGKLMLKCIGLIRCIAPASEDVVNDVWKVQQLLLYTGNPYALHSSLSGA